MQTVYVPHERHSVNNESNEDSRLAEDFQLTHDRVVNRRLVSSVTYTGDTEQVSDAAAFRWLLSQTTVVLCFSTNDADCEQNDARIGEDEPQDRAPSIVEIVYHKTTDEWTPVHVGALAHPGEE